MKIILSVLLLIGLSIGAYAKPIILGKDQAPVNARDYKILEAIAENAKLPISEFWHYKGDQFIVGPEGFLYWDRKKNGIIDGEDEAIFGTIVRGGNSYTTNSKGDVTGITIEESKFNDTRLLNELKKLVAINLWENKIKELNIANLPDLRFLSLWGDEYRDVVSLKNFHF